MIVAPNVPAAVGQTPLIRLKRASEETGCTILGKAEFMNPGQSVKDRAALYIIEDAIAKGQLRPGGTIVEGTAGNTGIGLTVIGNAMGFRTVIVIPDTQTQEKKDTLRLLGAELVEVPALPYKNPNNYIKYAQRLAEALAKSEPNGAVFANQFDNVANREAHVATTGPEIWPRPTAGSMASSAPSDQAARLPALAAASAPNAPTSRSASPILQEPPCIAIYTTGELKSEGSSITEGIGQGRITNNLEGLKVDHCLPDPGRTKSVALVFQMWQKKASASAPRPASTSLAPSASPRCLDPAKRSSQSCATTAHAISPSCSIRNSCAQKTYRYPPG